MKALRRGPDDCGPSPGAEISRLILLIDHAEKLKQQAPIFLLDFYRICYNLKIASHNNH